MFYRWLESVAAGKPLETEAARARVAELWALEQELADEASILQGMKTDKDTIESLLTGKNLLDFMGILNNVWKLLKVLDFTNFCQG